MGNACQRLSHKALRDECYRLTLTILHNILRRISVDWVCHEVDVALYLGYNHQAKTDHLGIDACQRRSVIARDLVSTAIWIQL